MKMDRISLDLGLDLTMDALVSRAEQLVKLEMDALADKSTHVYNLQRKVSHCSMYDPLSRSEFKSAFLFVSSEVILDTC